MTANKPAALAAGYSGTPLAKKLGIKAGSRLLLIDAPPSFATLLEPLPEAVELVAKSTAATDIVHLFCRQKSVLKAALAGFRRSLRDDAVLWISWPKKSSKVPSEISEDTIRELCLPLGWVDIKVCAIDETWSGLKLVLRRELRT
jgi:hypothetical protein